MEFRKIRDAADARDCLAAAEQSGVPRRAWARNNGIDPCSLGRWHVLLAEKPAKVPPLRIVELAAAPSVASATTYTIYAGSYRVTLGDRFEPESLRRILGVLQAC